MNRLNEIKKLLDAQKDYLAAEYGVTIVGVFGSYVRGEQRRDSDVDILIELERPPRISLIGLVELEYYFAVIRALEIIGEATKRLPMGVREQYPEIPWTGMAGMRDRIIHGYDTVDLRSCGT